MKRLFLFLFAASLLFVQNSCSDTEKVQPLEESEVVTATNVGEYALFETKNMWTFIKLNTADGRMWVVSYSTSGSPGYRVLSTHSLVPNDNPRTKDRFTLYPTENMWNFILLDKVDGRSWQVQWSFDGTNDFVVPIEKYGILD